MSVKMKSNDPAYWMLFDGIETTSVVYNENCYICNDTEFAQMGLPLCRKCPVCGGHITADDSYCDDCNLDEESFWYAIRERNKNLICFVTRIIIDNSPFEEYQLIKPSSELMQKALMAYNIETNNNADIVTCVKHKNHHYGNS